MISEYKSNIIIATSVVAIILIFLLLPFSIYGQDGYFLWFPIVAEYLAGDKYYHASEVIFNGQNLAGVYGELPFWKLIRLFHPSIEVFLNLTHGIWVICFALLGLSITRGIKDEKKSSDILIMFIYALITPIAINRVMAGHLNLLFGTLPLFVLISLIFNKSYLNCLFGIFCIWCALSTQAFQILSYHLFYVPLLIYLIWKFEPNKKNYLFLVSGILVTAFALNYDNFLEMFHHATNSNNLRSIDSKMVYSYTVTNFMDGIQFLTSGIYPEILKRDVGFFHEINYPLGAFIAAVFVVKADRKFAVGIILGLLVLFLFCMDAPVFNILRNLPYFIKPYRVPQRVFMMAALFIPLWSFGRLELNVKTKDIILLLVLIILAQFISYFEILSMIAVLILFFYPKYKNLSIGCMIALAGLSTGSVEKISPSLAAHTDYVRTKHILEPLKTQFSDTELRTSKFHFKTAEPGLVNYVAQSIGIATLEGYGHPPATLLRQFIEATHLRYSPQTNTLYLPHIIDHPEEIYLMLGITKEVSFDLDNKMLVKSF